MQLGGLLRIYPGPVLYAHTSLVVKSHRILFVKQTNFPHIQSTKKLLPGGGPQGAFFGEMIFMLKFCGAFLRPPILECGGWLILAFKVGFLPIFQEIIM